MKHSLWQTTERKVIQTPEVLEASKDAFGSRSLRVQRGKLRAISLHGRVFAEHLQPLCACAVVGLSETKKASSFQGTDRGLTIVPPPALLGALASVGSLEALALALFRYYRECN